MKVGLCNGCFDRFHNGHRHFLEQARIACDYLIVAVNTDDSVRILKGLGRPAETLQVRMRQIQVHGCANAIIPFAGDDRALIRDLDPDIVIKGQEYTRQPYWNSFTRAGGHIVWVPRLPGFSTTRAIAEEELCPK